MKIKVFDLITLNKDNEALVSRGIKKDQAAPEEVPHTVD